MQNADREKKVMLLLGYQKCNSEIVTGPDGVQYGGSRWLVEGVYVNDNRGCWRRILILSWLME